MSPIDVKTLGTSTPRTLDGRSYPDHLRPYEVHDQELLPLIARMQPATFDRLSIAVDDPRLRAVLPRWLASAQWRGLVERLDPTTRSPRRYQLGSHADRLLEHLE
jgi:hypothetical protein